jgi:hypothetical protein
METKELIQKELQSFAEQFTQSIIAQFQRCLVPIEEKLAKSDELIEQRLAKLEGSSKGKNVQDDHQFRSPNSALFDEVPERRESFGGRRSLSVSDETSTLSGALSATRLKQPEIKYSEEMTIEQVIKFLDECLQYISNWEALPANKGKSFPDAEHFPLSIMPKEVAAWVCTTTELIFDMTSMHQYSEATVHRLTTERKWWKFQNGDSIRSLLVKARNENAANTVMLQRLHKITWKSTSPYSLNAFAKFSHDIAQELRFTEGGEFQYEPVDLKDFVISSFPDPKFQKELYSIYGHRGILKVQRFEIGMILERINQRIKCFMKENVHAEMNASAAHRRDAKPKVNFVDSFFESDDGEEILEQRKTLQGYIQDSVNAVMINPSNCSRIGVGSDGKLLCKYLGGDKKTCTFKHPQSDMSLKGTGVSLDTTSIMPKSFNKHSHSGKVHSVQEVDVDGLEENDDAE